MRRWLAFGCLLLLSVPAWCEEKKASDFNTLSPKEIAEGWILLFDGETTFGWQIDGEAKVENGELVLGGSKATTARPTTDFGKYELHIDHITGGPIGLGKTPLSMRNNGSLRFTVEPPVYKGIRDLFPLHVEAGTVARVRGIKIQPQGLKPLFNGKDLTGWKKFTGEPKRMKSQFGVTKEGWLHLQDGAGDLQTEAQFGDFVLQIECRSNGPHLNSGVFFRCIPGRYQQGYEAQIRNQFTSQPTQEYTVEDYDPKTNKLVGKRKVKSTAVDYGTGAIYRRVPDRSAAAKDGEWFTMTVAADGRHLATWVNGVQQADWTDDRPLKDNARNGCRLEKGAISLQGHDKTTDLDFRNIRIAEFSAAK